MLPFINSKRRAELEQFVQSLATDLAKRYPPELDTNLNSHTSINRLTRILEETCKKAADYQKTNNLGILGKAKFGNIFKWSLIEQGYSKKFVEVATEAIIVHLTKK